MRSRQEAFAPSSSWPLTTGVTRLRCRRAPSAVPRRLEGRNSVNDSQKQGLMAVVFGVAIILVAAAAVVLILGVVKL
jgi:hypothetical protein